MPTRRSLHAREGARAPRPGPSLADQIARDRTLDAQRYQTRTAALEAVAAAVEHVATALDRGTAQLAAALCHASDKGEATVALVRAVERAGHLLADAIDRHESPTDD